MMALLRTGGLLAVLLGMLLYPKVMVAVKYTLDHFAGGFSGAKAVLLVLFLTILSAVQPLPSVWKPKWNNYFVAGLGFLYVLVVAEYVYYVRLFGLPLNQRSVLVYDGMQSSTRLEHIHNCKAALSALIPYLGQGFDAGAPFVAVYPKVLIIFHGLVFLVVCVMSVLLMQYYGKRLSPEKTVFLALGLYPLVKGVVDGGPFSLPDAGRLAFLAVVFLKGPRQRAALALSLLLMTTALFIEADKGLVHNLLRLGIAMLGLSLPLLFEKARRGTSPSGWVGAVVATIAFLGAPVLTYNLYSVQRTPPFSLAAWEYGTSALKEGWTVHVVHKGELKECEVGEITGTQKANRLSVSRLKLSRDTTPFELCRLFRLNVLRTPVVWYQEPGYVVVEGPFKMPNPEEWLNNPIVLRYSYKEEPEQTRLVLELIPGAQTNVACDLLPKGPFPTRRVDLTYTVPEGENWEEVVR